MVECVPIARVVVLANGASANEFRMYKGLRQGGPLSPFFIHPGDRSFAFDVSKGEGIGEEEFLFRMATICKCKIEELPFNYLGVPLGADPRKIFSWNGIVERVERKLSG
ncbi:hypothetical protein J1N35_028546 [Gossypium stocksii]|uniref:Reverse transcriptase domain-containing protein n=1 Tax=Gossypium stocksii TaxID=47602 RepID=A0A9D3UY41_9ROSI|nr:hypothetical protein J1N35_028546 [Gossypium stocksii]